MSTALQRLASWFKSQVDGSWESDWGITLQTLDNPGWMLEVNLDGTPLYNAPFKHLKTRRGKDDWVECAIQDHGRAGGDAAGRIFAAAGGPGNLEEIVNIFCDWAEQNSRGSQSRQSRPGSQPPSRESQNRSQRPSGPAHRSSRGSQGRSGSSDSRRF